MPIVGVDHVQLAMPAGGEDLARRFYGDVLGLEDVPKPTALIVRCVEAGHPVEQAIPLPGVDRVYVADPFGNRIELMERRDGGGAVSSGRNHL